MQLFLHLLIFHRRPLPLVGFTQKRWTILSVISYRKKHQIWSAFAERTAEEQVKFPALMGAAFFKKYNDENGTFPPPQFKDAAVI